MKKIQLTIAFLLLLFVQSSIAQYNLTVDKLATPSATVFNTVQAAINAVPTGQTAPYTIFVKNGKYREKITVPSNKPFIQMIGESVANVFIYYDDPATVLGTQNSASFTVNANDFSAFNITFANTFGDGSQAVAVLVNADRSAFKNCRFLANQDTLYLKGSGSPRAYFKDCYIDGNVDFIFGSSIGYFDNCVVYAKTRTSTGSSFITAPNTPLPGSTNNNQAYGFVFNNARFTMNTGGTLYYLSRPWPSSSEATTRQKAVVLSSKLSSHIQPAGWSIWDANTITANLTNAEYNSTYFNGTAVDISQRAPWSLQYNATDAANFTIANMFALPAPAWDPCTVYAGICIPQIEDIAVANFRYAKVASNTNFNWNISWPMTGIQYELFSSNDNINFTVVNTQTATNDTAVNFNYSELVPAPGTSKYYFVKASKAGLASHFTDTLNVSSIPTITTTGTLGSFIQGLGTPSNSQSYFVSGVNLTNNIVITAPANYEISSDNGITWNNASTPIVLTPVSNTVPSTPISVRLNALTAGTYSGNITHMSTGATTINVAITGTTQTAIIAPSILLEHWPLTTNNIDSIAVRAAGVVGTTPTFSRLSLSDGSVIPAYSSLLGQSFAPTAAGLWSTAAPGPGGNLNRTFYEEFTITAASTHTLKIDSIILNNSFYATTSNTKLAIVYSKNGFSTSPRDSVEVANATFAAPTVLTVNENSATTNNFRYALNSTTGVTINAGQTLYVRIYNSCGSSSTGRYSKLKDVQFKGVTVLNPIVGDYQSHQSGDWSDVNTWERFDGSAWTYPAPTYPVYNNSATTNILSGHTVNISATLTNGSGYIHLTKIKTGGQLIVATGATLNLANDGTTATDLLVDGTLTANGVLGTNGNFVTVINGTFVNSTTSMNLSNTGDSVYVNSGGIYQHNTNSNNTPLNFVGRAGSTFKVTGITTNQTGLFKSAVTYGNIIWDCNQAATKYYAFRSNLAGNVLGSFTVNNTGTTYISFANTSVNTSFPGGFYQTGGTVNFNESGTVTDSLFVGADFNVSGGTFNSNTGAGSKLALVLNGTNKVLNHFAGNLNNTNINVNGVYNLTSNLVLPSAGAGAIVNGTLNTGSSIISGSGDFTSLTNGIISFGNTGGVNGNITVSGTKNFGTNTNFIFNGTAAQNSGALLPSNINSLTINNAAGVTLGSNTTVATSITCTNGKLVLGNNNITASSVLGANANNYIVTDGTGSLKINNIGAGNTLFPVGPTSTSYNPISISNSGTVDNFSVKVKTTVDNAPADPTKIVNMQWDIAEDVIGGSNVIVKPTWNTTDEASAFNRASSIVVGHFNTNTSAWEETAATLSGSNPYSAQSNTGFTSFSPFIIANANAALLPLTLISFTGEQANNNINLKWTTSNEINTSHFEIQKSTNAIKFEKAGSVIAFNNTNINNYSFVDVDSKLPVVYYRLKIVDVDGQFSYSNIVVFKNNGNSALVLFPNPVENTTFLTHNKATANATLSIYSNDGKLIYKQLVKQNTTSSAIETKQLIPGIYILKFVNNHTTNTISLIKK
jgi:pectin methylesterase-like acyl-CoA thioesterase